MKFGAAAGHERRGAKRQRVGAAVAPRARSGRDPRRSDRRRLVATVAPLACSLLLLLTAAPSATAATVTWVAPFSGAVSSNGHSVSLSGCGSARAPLPKWTALTGVVTELAASTVKNCPSQYGGIGSSSSASAGGSLGLSFPLRVGSAGNHTFATNVTVTLTTHRANTVGGCPAPNVPYPQPQNSWNYAECVSASNLAFSLSAAVVDLDNYFWGSNGSGFTATSAVGWMNYTYCDNWIGQGPTCANTTGGWITGGLSGVNAPGYSSFSWTGSTTVVLWTNGTGMVRSHHYALVITVALDDSAGVTSYNLLGPWHATAKAAIDMANLGNLFRLNSVRIT
jgi:hypothetical protein